MASDETIRPSGSMVLHAEADWPCSMCRPRTSKEGRGDFLCVECAGELVATSFARLDGADDEEEKLTTAGDHVAETSPETTWQLLHYGLVDAKDR